MPETGIPGRKGRSLGVLGLLVISGLLNVFIAGGAAEPFWRAVLGGLGFLDAVLAAAWVLGLPAVPSLVLARAAFGMAFGLGLMFALSLGVGLSLSLLAMALGIAAIPRGRLPLLLILPGTFYLLVFFAFAVGIIAVISFLKRGPYGGIRWIFVLENYQRALDPLYVQIVLISLWIALVTTGLCLLIGYPVAYAMARAPARWRNTLLILTMIPFWTNFLVRTLALMFVLRSDGPINGLLMSAGLIREPLSLLFTQSAVILGLVYGELPFMILPLYATLERFDFSLVEAAHDLGANEWHAFRRVIWPLTLPGVLAGSTLVFIPSVGAFITPDLLGGAKTIMIGNVIQYQFLTVRHWPFGSALSLILMAMVLAATMVYLRVGGRERVL
ncbi:ABC transporter permease [Thermoflexus sp.]|uniref:ABC transporter permease n=1 Tax=Thermoflexus sp. TaxID=1969742 RepID=UPI0035E40F1A